MEGYHYRSVLTNVIAMVIEKATNKESTRSFRKALMAKIKNRTGCGDSS